MAALGELLAAVLLIALTAIRILPSPTIPMFVLGWLSLRLRHQSWQAVGLSPPVSWKSTLVLAVLGGALYQLADIYLILPLLYLLTGEAVDLSQFELLRGNTNGYLIGLILAWTLAALGEEIVFRGYLLNRAADVFYKTVPGWIFAVGLTSAIFGVAHFSQGFTGVLDNAVMAAFMAVLYLRSNRNLWLPIFSHGIIDTIGFTLIFLGYYP